MVYINEPPGIDFIIQSQPLADEERTAISEFISNYKTKQKVKRNSRSKTTGTKNKKVST